MQKKDVPPTTDTFISAALGVFCKRHKREPGEACWWVPSNVSRETFRGICNDRAKRAGFIAKISPQSLSRGQAQRAKK